MHRLSAAQAPLSFIVGVLFAATAIAQEPPPAFAELGLTVQGYAAGVAGFALGDFDADGRPDLVVSGHLNRYNSANGAVLQVIGASQDGIGVKQTILLRTPGLSRVLKWTAEDGSAHLLSIDSDGLVTEWAGWPLQSIRTFSVAAGISAAVIGDIDNDGRLELLTLQTPGLGGLVAHDLATGQVKWARPDLGGVDMIVAQLDADPALEIVIAAWHLPGLVLDGATQATEWTYSEGFGSHLSAGRVLGGTASGFAAANDWGLFGVFGADPWSSRWSLSAPRDTDALAVGDLDGDGRDEVIRADGQWGSIHLHDGASGADRLAITNPAHGVSALTAVDLGGSGQPAIAFTPASIHFPEDPLLQLSSPIDGSTLYTLPYLPPPYAPVRVAKMGTTDRVQMVHALQGANPHTRVVDVQDGRELWRSPAPGSTDSPFQRFAPGSFHLSNAPEGRKQLLVAGNVTYSGQVIALDPDSFAVLWTAGGENDPVTASRGFGGTVMFDFNEDGVDDLVACASGSAPNGARVLVFSGRDGSQLWQSITLGANSGCTGMLAGEFGDWKGVVVVLGNALYAFNPQTHLLDWTLDIAASAAYLLGGVDGPELAILQDRSLHFFRASDRELLRTVEFDATVSHVQQLGGDIHTLLVATDGMLQLVDGVTGQVAAQSSYVGEWLGHASSPQPFDALATGSGAYLIGVGNGNGVFRFRLVLTDDMFSHGFEQPD